MDFTRGSQVAETIAMMFGTALRPMIYASLAMISGFIALLVWTGTHPGNSYYWLMHAYASAWVWVGFSPAKIVSLKTLTEGNVHVHIAAVRSYPPLQAAWHRLWTAVWGGVGYGLAVGVPVAIGSAILLRRFGTGLTRRRHQRGSQLATLPTLLTEVTEFNRIEGRADRLNDLRRVLGHAPWHRKLLALRAELIAAGAYEPYRIAGVPYPWRAEQTHTMLVGTTGTGKSTVMKDLLYQIRARDGRAVVFDLTGTYVECFYNPATDIILNPFDARCPKWSPFSDATTREHFKEASLALVPIKDGGGDSFWPDAARMLFVEACVRLVEQGNGTSEALSDVLMTSKLKDLHAHVMKTVAAPLTDPEAKRMAESIRATFNTYAQALNTLPNEGVPFSVREWVEASDGHVDADGIHHRAPGSILFIAARNNNLRSVRVLLTLWLTTAIDTLMSMPGDQRDIRLWFLLDEINALHNIPAIVAGMQTARNYGGAFVLGVHTMHQLKQTYGEDLAETVASLAKTKLLMSTRDKGTQDWSSAQVGEGEWSDMEENFSYGVSNVRDAATLQRKVKLEPLVLPSEFAELRDLTGYLKFPQGLPAALVRVTYVKYRRLAPGFVERKIAPLAPPPRPPLALPHHVTVNGVRVTRDGEIVELPAAFTSPPENPADDATDGYQATTAATVDSTPPERDIEETRRKARAFVEDHAGNERNPASLIDPLSAPGRIADGGANSAVVAADQQDRGVERQRDAATAKPGADAPRVGLVIQEQRQSFGEEERARHRDRASGNNVPAHHLAPEVGAEADHGIDEDECRV